MLRAVHGGMLGLLIRSTSGSGKHDCVAVVAAARRVRRPAAGMDRQLQATDIAEAMALEEELTTTLLDELRQHLRRRQARRRCTAACPAPRVARVVDRRRRTGEIAGRDARFGDDQLRFGVPRDRHHRAERRILVRRPDARAGRRAVPVRVRHRDARIGRAVDRHTAERRIDRDRSCSG